MPLDLTIGDVAYRGAGVARDPDGRVVFVPRTLPGEVVRCRIVRERKSFADAAPESILSASPDRVPPACPLFEVCPGCAYQHARYEAELSFKQAQLEDLLARIAGVTDVVFREPFAAPQPLGYRNKIVLHARTGSPGAADGVTLGYIAEDNESLLDVPICPLAHDEINARLAEIRSDARFLSSISGRATLTLRRTDADGVLAWLGRAPGGSETWLTEQTGHGTYRVPRGSFFQVNPGVSDALVEHVTKILRDNSMKVAVDLYCGVGVFALAAARAGAEQVIGIDSDRAAIRAAARNAGDAGLGNVAFEARRAGAAARRILARGQPAETVLILDPSRRGLDKSVIEAVTQAPPATIVYVSCAADTLARDIRRLRGCGYELKSARLFDMFPRTPYFETVARLTRS